MGRRRSGSSGSGYGQVAAGSCECVMNLRVAQNEGELLDELRNC